MNILFVAGPGRSGTTAFAQYLNRHPGILVCRERYKFIPKEITPGLFAFDRILDHREGETNQPRGYHAGLLAKKEPEKLEWIGDKNPGYVNDFRTLHTNNPGARFVVMHRPAEEVAESYDARSKNPDDAWLGGKNGFELGVRDWNAAMKKTREFAESDMNPNVLIVGYHDFFYRNESFIPLISRFLDIEFDEAVRRSWRRMSLRFEEKRRDKEPLDGKQAKFIAKNKDHAAEAWVLDRIERQWSELGDADDAPDRRPNSGKKPSRTMDGSLEQELRKRLRERNRRIEELEGGLLEERVKARRLEQRNRTLELKIEELERRGQSSQASILNELPEKLGRLKDALSKRFR